MLVFDQPTRTGDVLLLACHGRTLLPCKCRVSHHVVACSERFLVDQRVFCNIVVILTHYTRYNVMQLHQVYSPT